MDKTDLLKALQEMMDNLKSQIAVIEEMISIEQEKGDSGASAFLNELADRAVASGEFKVIDVKVDKNGDASKELMK